jgi:predicted ester cyclase
MDSKPPAAVAPRFTFSPAVEVILRSASPEGEVARAWVRYSQGLVGEAGIRLEDVVSADVRCLELEAAGFPPGIAGLRLFREQVNSALPDESAYVAQMQFPAPGTIEVELHATGTHTAQFMGRRASGQRLWFLVRTLNKFQDGRMVARWDRADFSQALRQIDNALAQVDAGRTS